MNFEKKYNKSFNKNIVLRINLFYPRNNFINGIILKNKEEYIIVAKFTDFSFYGICVIPKQNIKNLRDNKYEECENKIIRKNKEIYKAILPKYFKKNSSLKECLKIIKKQNIWPSIEAQNKNTKSTAYFIGPLKKIKKNSLKIKCYDAKGKWEDIYNIGYLNILNITILGNYEEYFNSYMKNKKY